MAGSDFYRRSPQSMTSRVMLPDFRCCEGFRMPADDDGATHSGAGVRKPPREETAERRAKWRVRRYGDFVVGGVCRTFVERVLRTRSRRLADLIGRPRWAEPALN